MDPNHDLVISWYKIYFKEKELEKDYSKFNLVVSRQKTFYFCIFYSIFKVLISLFFYLNFQSIFLTQFIASLAYVIILLSISCFLQRIDKFVNLIILKIMVLILGIVHEDILLITIINSSIETSCQIRILYSFMMFNFACQILLLDFSQLLKMFSVFNSLVILIVMVFFNFPTSKLYFELFFFVLVIVISERLFFENNKINRLLYLEIKNHKLTKNYANSMFQGMPLMMLVLKNKSNHRINNRFNMFINSLYNKEKSSKKKAINRPLIPNDDVLKLNNNMSIESKLKNVELQEKNQTTSILHNKTLNNLIEIAPENYEESKKAKCDREKKEVNQKLNPIFNNLIVYELKDQSFKKYINNESDQQIKSLNISLDMIITFIRLSNDISPFEEFKSIGYFEFNKKKFSEKFSNQSLIDHVNENTQGDYFEIYYRKVMEKNEENIEILINNISSLKDLEKESAENKYKHQILSKVAHEFKTPLITIISLVRELIRSQDNYENYLNQINNLSYYIIFLVNDIVDYVNNSNINLVIEEINLNQIVQFSYEILKIMMKYQNKSKIKHYLCLDPELANVKIYTDSNRILQILLNLISNSIKFTKKGYIKIITRKKSNNKITIEVEDTGSGMKNELVRSLERVKENINAHINQTEVIGSGLGITICQKISKQLQTKIEIQSSLGKGTSVSFEVKNLIEMRTKTSSSNVATYKKISDNSKISSHFEDQKFNNIGKNHILDVLKEESESDYNSSCRSSIDNLSIEKAPRKGNCSKFSTIRIESSAFQTKFVHLESQAISSEYHQLNSTVILNKDIILDESMRRDINKSFTFTDNNKVENKGNKNLYINYTPDRFNSRNSFSQNITTKSKDSDIIVKSKISSKFNLYEERTNDKTTSDHVKNHLKLNLSKISGGNIKENDFNFQIINTKCSQVDFSKEKQCILIVDDNKLCRDHLEKQLRDNLPNKLSDKIDIMHCSDGVELLNLITQQIQIICCFLDENMEFMNGSEAVRIIRKWETTKNIVVKFKIISVSAVSDMNQTAEIRKSGVDIILQKPTKNSDIKNIFDQINIESLIA